MAVPNYNEIEDVHHYEPIDQWTCLRCFKNISSSRPPIFNADNCSCSEVGYTNSGDDQALQTSHEQVLYDYEIGTQIYQNAPVSYASSSQSATFPEGPEREEPKIQLTHGYLPLCPGPGLNEIEHRRSSSFRSDMSLPMRRFLVEEGYPQSVYATEHSSSGGHFLPQDIHISSPTSKRVQKGSKLSHMSSSSGNGEASFHSWGVDPVTEAGAWADEMGYANTSDGFRYPMYMSGVSERRLGEGEN